MTKPKTVKIGGKEVPLTKSGLPNKVYLSKDAKAIVKTFEDKLKNTKKENVEKEINDLLNSLIK